MEGNLGFFALNSIDIFFHVVGPRFAPALSTRTCLSLGGRDSVLSSQTQGNGPGAHQSLSEQSNLGRPWPQTTLGHLAPALA